MIEHVVIFKWAATATETQINAALAALRTLKDRIPGVISLSVGNTITERGQGFTTGLVVRMESAETLAAYGPHPAHQEVLNNFIVPIKDNIIAIDYVVD
ncbi:MAG: Dabb family protein [Chthonomonadales bacterium]